MFTGTKLTTKGSELIAYLHANNLPLILTNMRLGDGVSETFDLSELVSEKMQTQIEYITQQGTASVIRATFTNENLQSGFHVREVGIFALGENNEEVLYAYDNAGNGSVDYFESGTNNVIYKEVFEIATTISNAVDVQLQIEPKYVFVTEEQFEKLKEETQKKVENTGVYTHNKLYSRNDIFKYNGNMYLTETDFTGAAVPDFSKVYMLTRKNAYDYFSVDIDFKNYSNPSKLNGGIKYSGGCEAFTQNDWVEFLGYRPCILVGQGNVETYLDPNNYSKNLNGESVDITTLDENSTTLTCRNVMVVYPRIGYSSFCDRTSKKMTIRVTNDPTNLSYSYAAFDKGKRKGHKFFLGAYSGRVESGKLYSISGVDCTYTGNLSSYRTYAQANGDNYGIIDHKKITFIQLMFIVQNGIINGKVSNGYDTNHLITGELNENGMNVNSISTDRRKILGIESCCFYEHVDGCGIDNYLNLRVCDNAEVNDTFSGYDNLGKVYQCGTGYRGASIIFDEVSGLISTINNGTSDTYFHCPEFAKVASTTEVWGGANVFETRFTWGATKNFTSSARLCFQN